MDTFEEDIWKGYASDLFFQLVTEKAGTNPSFENRKGIIWARNRGGEDVVCVPSANSTNTTLRMRIIEQAHQVVGHYGPQRTADYIRWWCW